MIRFVRTIKYISAFSLACIAILSGCSGNDEKEGGDFVLSLKVTGIEGTAVKAAVTVTGSSDDTYICFCSKNTDVGLTDLVKAEMSRLGDRLQSELNSGNKLFVFDNLDEYTPYLVVAAGVSKDGSITGTPVSVSATTGKGETAYKENPAWKIFYDGRGLSSKGIASDFVTVRSTSDDRYFTILYPVDAYANYSSIAQFIEDMTAFIASTLASYEAQGIHLTWKDVTLDKGIEKQANKLLLDDKQYMAFAIGVDENGENTGYYAVSEVFSPQLIPADDNYRAWVGTWTVTGANGETSSPKITGATSGLSYTMTAFGLPNAPSVETAFDSATGEMVFYSRSAVAEWPTEWGTGQLGFYPGILGQNMKITPVIGDGREMARAKLDAGGKTATITAVKIPVSGMGEQTPLNMGFAVYFENGGNVTYSETPTFPMKMTYVGNMGE